MSTSVTTNKQILQLILDSLKYMPFVYTETGNITDGQRNATTEVYYIRHKSEALDANSLIFFVPNTPGKNINYIKILSPTDGYDPIKSKSYRVYVEKADGQATEALGSAIAPGRLLMLRLKFQPTATAPGVLIVVNDPHKGSLTATDLTVTGTSNFSVAPTVGVDQLKLVNISELNALVNRVKKLEDRILIGTEDPAQALQDAPEGTIYLQVDNYGNEDQ
jgi:hypothetical protein